MKQDILEIAQELENNSRFTKIFPDFQKKIDKALDSETSESLKKWLHSKRL